VAVRAAERAEEERAAAAARGIERPTRDERSDGSTSPRAAAALSDESMSESSSSGSSEEEEEEGGADDGFDAGEKLPEFKKMAAARGGGLRRGSISGESTQSMLQAAAQAASVASAKPRKSNEQRARIDAAVKDNLLFSSFKGVQLVDGKWRTAAGEDRAEALEKLHQCMEEKVFGYGPGAKDIITQGDEGEYFYVIDSGACEVLISGQRVATCGPGDSFGELALMYFAPRAATIRATERTVAWAMDRLSFQGLLQKSGSERREEAKSMMVMCPLLEPLDEYERDQVVDALQEEVYADGMYILAEGDVGDAMYILQEGVCEAVKKTVYGEAAMTSYEAGDYFGELALLTKAPRKASVVSRGEVKVARLGRKPFQRLVGKCDEVLRRNRQLYAEMNVALDEMLVEEEVAPAVSPAKTQLDRERASLEAMEKEFLEREQTKSRPPQAKPTEAKAAEPLARFDGMLSTDMSMEIFRVVNELVVDRAIAGGARARWWGAFQDCGGGKFQIVLSNVDDEPSTLEA
jgi:cAMP-dependent protein kinase regulator